MSTGEPIPPRHAPPYTAGLPTAEEILSHLQQGGLWHCRLTDEHGRSCVGIAQLYVNEQGCIKMRRPAWWPLWMSEEKKLLPEVIQVRPCAEDLTPLPSVGDEPEYREGLPSVALARAHARPVDQGLWHFQVVRTRDGTVVTSGIISGRTRWARWLNEIKMPGSHDGFILHRGVKRGEFMVRVRPCGEDLAPVSWPNVMTLPRHASPSTAELSIAAPTSPEGQPLRHAPPSTAELSIAAAELSIAAPTSPEGQPLRHAPPYTPGLPTAEEILSHLQQGGLWHCRLTDEHGRSCVGIAQLYVNEHGCIKMRRPAWWPYWMPGEKKLLPEVIQMRPCAEDLSPLPSVGDEPEYREGLPSVALARAHARPVEKPTGSHGVIVATRGLWHCQVVRTEDGVVVASGIISMSASGQLKQAKWGHEVPGFYGRFVLRMVSGAIMVRTRPCEEDLTPVPWP